MSFASLVAPGDDEGESKTESRGARPPPKTGRTCSRLPGVCQPVGEARQTKVFNDLCGARDSRLSGVRSRGAIRQSQRHAHLSLPLLLDLLERPVPFAHRLTQG